MSEQTESLEQTEGYVCYKCHVRPGRTVYNRQCEECANGIALPPRPHLKGESLLAEDTGETNADDLLSLPVACLSLPQRIINGLEGMGVILVGDLVKNSKGEILGVKKGIGSDSVRRIEEVLLGLGLQLKEDKKVKT